MKLFEFFKSKETLNSEFNLLKQVSLLEIENSKIIKISSDITIENLSNLLDFLRVHKIAFAFYDILYPSPSDPGAYFTYSQEKNETEKSWSLTLGNHGWSGGIYTISEINIVKQLYNLIKHNQLEALNIHQVGFMSYYDLENIDFNINLNALIFGIHNKIEKLDIDYLIFGLFSSDNYEPYYIFKLTNQNLYIDKRRNWHSDRHTKKGYVFEGEKLDKISFEKAKNLLNSIPSKLLIQKWKGFYTIGNKNEDQLILEFKNSDFKKTISINSYEIETENLPKEIRDFRLKIEKIISELNDKK